MEIFYSSLNRELLYQMVGVIDIQLSTIPRAKALEARAILLRGSDCNAVWLGPRRMKTPILVKLV